MAQYVFYSVWLSSLLHDRIGSVFPQIAWTQPQALLGIMTSCYRVLLSGYAAPIENMPSWLQPLT